MESTVRKLSDLCLLIKAYRSLVKSNGTFEQGQVLQPQADQAVQHSSIIRILTTLPATRYTSLQDHNAKSNFEATIDVAL